MRGHLFQYGHAAGKIDLSSDRESKLAELCRLVLRNSVKLRFRAVAGCCCDFLHPVRAVVRGELPSNLDLQALIFCAWNHLQRLLSTLDLPDKPRWWLSQRADAGLSLSCLTQARSGRLDLVAAVSVNLLVRPTAPQYHPIQRLWFRDHHIFVDRDKSYRLVHSLDRST